MNVPRTAYERFITNAYHRSAQPPRQVSWGLTLSASTANCFWLSNYLGVVCAGRARAYPSDNVLEADTVLPTRRSVYPTHLNERGDVCRCLSELEPALNECGLLGRVSRKNAEPAVGDILYLSSEGRCFFLRMMRGQFITLKLPSDRIARMASFYSGL